MGSSDYTHIRIIILNSFRAKAHYLYIMRGPRRLTAVPLNPPGIPGGVPCSHTGPNARTEFF